MIVICSENSFKSKWVSLEILSFKINHTNHDIIPILIDGSPESSIPESLLNIFKQEPWAPDFRKVKTSLKIKNDKHNWYHLIASIYDLERAVVENREIKKKINKGIIVLLFSIFIFGLSLFLNHQNSIINIETLKKKSLEFVTKAENAQDVEEALNYSLLAVESYQTPESVKKLHEALENLFTQIETRYSEGKDESNNKHYSTLKGSFVAISKSNSKLFIASPLGSSIIYNIVTGQQQKFSSERYNAYIFAEFNNNGDIIATVDSHEKVSIWSLKGNEINLISRTDSLPGHFEVEQLLFSGNENLLLVKQMKGITLINVNDGKIFKTIDSGPIGNIEFDTKRKIFFEPGDGVTSPRVWSFITGEKIWEPKNKNDVYSFVRFINNDNTIVLKKEDHLLSISEDESIIIRDSLLFITLDKTNNVLSTELKDIREMTYNYAKSQNSTSIRKIPVFTKAKELVNIWNIKSKPPTIIKSIDLFSNDIAKLEADKKIFYDSTTVQIELIIAKRWLGYK